MTTVPSAAPPDPGSRLTRVLGRWDLTAIGVNQVIGGAIFLMPAQIAGIIGWWSLPAFVLAGFASLLVAWCFAEVASRFEGTGGAYLYTRAAFGRFVAFEVGWMQWFTRVTSQSSVANGFALAIGYFSPGLSTGVGRMAVLTALMLSLGWINARGIRQSAWVVNALTVGKLTPLLIFIALGLPFLRPEVVSTGRELSLTDMSTAALLLVFVFGGFDVVPVPAGEASDPRRHMPFALTMTIVIVTLVMTATQAVCMAVLPGIASSTTPVADAALVVLGSAGAAMVALGSALSMAGNNAGQVLSGSRMLFAVAENGDLPRWFAWVHPVHRTPATAVWFSTAVALVLAWSGSFAALAAASAMARLITYVGTCAATWRLRAPRFADRVAPPMWSTPGGAIVPAAAILVALAILAGLTRAQLFAGLGALGAGAVLYALAPKGSTAA